MSALSFDHVHLRYPDGGGVETEALSFEAGTITALLGPNGAGKSTLIKALAGVSNADIAGLRLLGQPLGDARMRARNIAYLSQTRTGPALATVRDVIALGRFPFGGQDKGVRVESVIDTLGLGPLEERKFGTLSGGEQARVLLGRALAVDAPVLLADEPAASLDPHFALRIMDTLRDEARRGRIVIVSLHDLNLAERYCDHALVLCGGQVAAHGPVPMALGDKVLRDVFRVTRTDSGLRPIT